MPPKRFGLPRPLDLLDRVVDVVEEDLGDPGAAAGRLGAEVGEPPVVGLDPGEPVVVVVTGGRLVRGEQAGRKERWDRVREQHFGDDAVVLELLRTTTGVPVAVGLGAAEIVERVLVRRRPLRRTRRATSPRGTRGSRASARRRDSPTRSRCSGRPRASPSVSPRFRLSKAERTSRLLRCPDETAA